MMRGYYERNSLYKFSKNTQVNTARVSIGDCASVWCEDAHITARVKAITLANVPDVRSRRYVFSIMKVIELIKKEVADVEINSVGESDFIISYKKPQKRSRLFEYVKIIFVGLIVFCGGAFAIIAYGNDVDINSVMESVCTFVTGDNNWLWVLQSSYCMGLGAGIIIFYNHIGRRKYEKDPTPLEVEMRLYEDDANTAIINESAREAKEQDVK